MDWITDNYWVIALVVYGLYAIFGKKKAAQANEANKQAQAQAQQARRQQQLAKAQAQSAQAQAGSKEQYRGRIEEALRNAMKEADREFFESRPPAGEAPEEKPAQSRMVGAESSQPASGSDDPFAFHSLMSAGEKGRVDYDKTAIDYDQTAIDYDKRSNAFAFRSAISEPVEKEYHLTGFGFHAAHALSAEDRRKAAGADAYEDAASGPAFSIGSGADLRRAIIIQEVLGKPKSMRKF